jgi:hypothetical protein
MNFPSAGLFAIRTQATNFGAWVGMQFVRNANGNITCVYNDDGTPVDYANPTAAGFAPGTFPWRNASPNNNVPPELCVAMQRDATPQPGFLDDYPCSVQRDGYICVEV